MLDVRRISFLETPCFLAYVSTLFIGSCIIWGILEWQRTQFSQEITESENLMKINTTFHEYHEPENKAVDVHQYTIHFSDDTRFVRSAPRSKSTSTGASDLRKSSPWSVDTRAVPSDLRDKGSLGSENVSRVVDFSPNVSVSTVKIDSKSSEEDVSILKDKNTLQDSKILMASVLESRNRLQSEIQDGINLKSEINFRKKSRLKRQDDENTPETETTPEAESTPESENSPEATASETESTSETPSDQKMTEAQIPEKSESQKNVFLKLEKFFNNHKDFVLSSLADVLDLEIKKQKVLDKLKEVFLTNGNKRSKRGSIDELKNEIIEVLMSEEMKDDIRQALAELVKALEGESGESN